MSKRTGVLCMIVAVGGLAVADVSSAAIPASMAGWWKLDDGTGTIARDATKNKRDGALVNGPVWAVGKIDGGLQFDGGDDFVRIPDNPAITFSATDSYTLAAWVYIPEVVGGWHGIICKGRQAGGGAAYYGIWIGDNGGTPTWYFGAWPTWGSAITEAGWYHVVVSQDGTAATKTLFINGEQDTLVGAQAANAAGNLVFGSDQEPGDSFAGTIDDVQLYRRPVTADQVAGIMAGNLPSWARAERPFPADGATGITSPLLQWSPGEGATFHDVYLGTSPELTEADRVATHLMALVTMHFHIPGFLLDTTYYWRVDEIAADGTVTTGTVWSFSVPPLTAYEPVPADGAGYQAINTDLSWQPGKNATSHEVYFSTNRDDVVNGATAAFKGAQLETTFDPQELQLDTTYYWRVDEVDTAQARHMGTVWSFTTMPLIPVGDPDLIGWWKFDEGESPIAVDWSGYGHHGTLIGRPTMADGIYGGGLALAGGSNVEIPALDVDSNNVTITAWIFRDGPQPPWAGIFYSRQGILSGLNFGNGSELRYVWAGQYWEWDSGLVVPNSQWSFVALAVTPNQATVCLNGSSASNSGTHQHDPFDSISRIGQDWVGRDLKGIVDDVRFYRKTLTQEEIETVMRGDLSVAWEPQPDRGAHVDIRSATALSWSAGEAAAKHDVYFGRDKIAVANASPDAAEYKGRQAGKSYSLAGLVEFGGGDYFWRIDEVEADGATIHKGNVWTFFVPACLIVDDFESYTDDLGDRVFQSWIDGFGYTEPEVVAGNGTGATVGYIQAPFAEQTIIHSGGQSMPMDYNNVNSPHYSEAERTFASAQDWTESGVDTLVLYFRGVKTNKPDKMYVAITDGVGKTAVVTNADPDAALAVQWTEWRIPLSDFAGVNTAKVSKMYIGFGDRDHPVVGGAGRVYIDDICLVKP